MLFPSPFPWSLFVPSPDSVISVGFGSFMLPSCSGIPWACSLLFSVAIYYQDLGCKPFDPSLHFRTSSVFPDAIRLSGRQQVACVLLRSNNVGKLTCQSAAPSQDQSSQTSSGRFPRQTVSAPDLRLYPAAAGPLLCGGVFWGSLC